MVAVAGGGGGEARVVGEHAPCGIELADVDHVGAGGGRAHRQLVRLSVEVRWRFWCLPWSSLLNWRAGRGVGAPAGLIRARSSPTPRRVEWPPVSRGGRRRPSGGRGFVPADDQHHVIDAWRGAPTLRARPAWGRRACRTSTHGNLGERGEFRLQRVSRPASICNCGVNSDSIPRDTSSSAGGFLVRLDGPFGQYELAFSSRSGRSARDP
jgi:hypothetical protein